MTHPAAAWLTDRLPEVGLVVSLLLFGVVAFRAHRNTIVLIDDAAAAASIHETIETLDVLDRRIVEAERARRGYALTGDESHLAGLSTAEDDTTRTLVRLRELVAHDPALLTAVGDLEPKAAKRLAHLRQAVERRRVHGFELAHEAAVTKEGASFTLGVRAAIDGIRGIEKARLALLDSTTRDLADVTKRTAVVGFSTGAALLIAAFLLLRAETRRRRAAEEHARHLLEATPDAIVIANERGRISIVNDRAPQLFGYRRDELVGQPIEILVPPRLRGAHEAHRRGYREQPRPRQMGDARLDVIGARKDGTEFPASISLSPLTRPDGTLVIAAVRDVTREKEAADELRAAKERTEAVNRELESFSYSVAHDLRAPLRAIDGFSQALLEDYASVLDDEGRDHLGRVRAAAQRMGQLIDDLLSLSRVSRAALSCEHVDISALARDVGAALGRSFPARQVALVVEDGLVAHADPRLLRIALENLLGNAWKFTAKRASAHVHVGAVTRDGERVFFVEDDGAGFDMAHAAKLFGAFQRLHRASEFEGTGIGLATVQRILHRHGGRAWAEAKVGEGATFFFTLRQAGSR